LLPTVGHGVPPVRARAYAAGPAAARQPFNLLKLGLFGMIPPLAATLGSRIGGLTGDYLLKRGWSLNKVRKTLVGGMLVCSVIVLAQSPADAKSPIPQRNWVILRLFADN
jgi:hypothetical protein